MVELVEVAKFNDLKPADQIAVRSSFKNLHESLKILYPLFSKKDYYYHHGVFLGKSEVIHFYGNNADDACPRICDIWPFSQGAEDRKLYRVEHKGPTLSVVETLEKSTEVLNSGSEWPKYHLLWNNCETLATWLKTGEKLSSQVSKGIIHAATSFGVGVGSSLAVGVSVSLTKR